MPVLGRSAQMSYPYWIWSISRCVKRLASELVQKAKSHKSVKSYCRHVHPECIWGGMLHFKLIGMIMTPNTKWWEIFGRSNGWQLVQYIIIYLAYLLIWLKIFPFTGTVYSTADMFRVNTETWLAHGEVSLNKLIYSMNQVIKMYQKAALRLRQHVITAYIHCNTHTVIHVD